MCAGLARRVRRARRLTHAVAAACQVERHREFREATFRQMESDILAQQEGGEGGAVDPTAELAGMTAEDLHRVLSQDSDSARRAMALRIIEGMYVFHEQPTNVTQYTPTRDWNLPERWDGKGKQLQDELSLLKTSALHELAGNPSQPEQRRAAAEQVIRDRVRLLDGAGGAGGVPSGESSPRSDL